MAHGIAAAGIMANAIGQRTTSGLADDQLTALKDHLSGSAQLVHLITEALTEELPMLARDGGFIRKGYDTVLDELFTLA
jgi:DNA mismatch repair ATPase MutS